MDFPSKPILRVETGRHTAAVRRIAVDRNQRYLVSGSLDKSVRIWDISDGRLLRTLRVPQGEGNVGKIYCVAISPDGATVTAGGFTGLAGAERFILVYDRESGEIRKVIGGHPKSIRHLTYSADGGYLAATLGDSNGLRVYETRNYALKAEDQAYGKDSYWADFDGAGRLVTTCYDGYIRLYDKQFGLIQKRKAPGGKQPFSAAFSPDGRSIAVGYDDTTRVNVLSADNLELRFSADTSDVANGSLLTVAWSEDGRFLYASGRYYTEGVFPIRRWRDGGRGIFTDFKLAQDTVMDLKPLSNGGMAMGAADHHVAVLSAVGQLVWERRGEIADFREQLGEDGIRLSENADTVQFGYEVSGKRQVRFSLKNFRLETDPPPAVSLYLPVAQASGLEVTDWEDSCAPKLNCAPLKLEEYERSCSLAIAPDHQSFLLGAAWSLHLFDHAGKELWRVDAPGIAWAVNISMDGRLAMAGLSDGTLRWYRMADGRELLALFPHADGKRWVVWTPQGYYQASAGAEDLIGWHINNGSNKAPDFYGASRFRDWFSRPDVVARVLETLDVDKALALADQARGTKTKTTDLKSVLPPTIKILSPAPGEKTTTNTLTLFYKAESATGPVTDVTLRVDGRPVTKKKDVYDQTQGDTRVGNITIEVPPQNAIVSLIAINRHGSSEPAIFHSKWEGTPDFYKPSLYVLAVGVSDYQMQNLNLKYAHKDAQDFVSSIREQEGGLYKKVTCELLVNGDGAENSTKDAILDGLDWLMHETTSRDVAMVFMSGHGINDSEGNYCFLPRDADTCRIERTCIDNYEFKRYLRNIPGKTVFFFDSCRSGSILGVKAIDQSPDVDKFANELADADAGVVVFSSSTGRQFSFENDDLKHGVFTAALLEGIAGRADYQRRGFVSIADLETFLADRVKELTKGRQKPVSAKPKAVEDWVIIQVRRSSEEVES